MARLTVVYALLCAIIIGSAYALAVDAASSPSPVSAASSGSAASPAPVALNEYPIKTPNSGARYLCKGPDSALWFTEFDANQIGRISVPDGSVLEYPLRTDVHPSVITTGPDGNLWFTQTSPPAAIVMLTSKGILKQFRLKIDYSGPVGITTGPDGNLWFTEFTVDKIGRITPAGVITEFALPAAPAGSPATPAAQSTPRGVTEITVGPDSNLWFTEENANQIGRITPDGTVTEFPLVGVNNYPTSIVSGPDKNLWFTEVGTGKIGRMTTAGLVTSWLIPTRHSGPSSMTVGPDGNIWFTETNVNQIAKINPKNGKITEVPLPPGDSGPFGITTGPDNALWFVESKANKIARYVL
jgi:virginiamycin B lyase